MVSFVGAPFDSTARGIVTTSGPAPRFCALATDADLSGDSGRFFYSVGVTIRVLYFAAVREIAGTSEMTIEVPEGTTVGNLATILERAVTGLSGRLPTLRWARNEEFVDLDVTLAEGDVVALIPPVAGGC